MDNMTKICVICCLVVFLFITGCAKNGSSNNTATNNKTDTLPLTGTVQKTDTLKVMAYNILNYGDACQGTTALLDTYFKSIIQNTQPDLLSCEKMSAFNPAPGASGNLADEILFNILNAAFPGLNSLYAYATPTNKSFGSDMSVLFYNQQKLTYVKTETLEAYITDFDLYKLFYNDINLSITHDTTFLFVLVNHTQSGSSSATRDQQVTTEMNSLRAKFSYFPNLLIMGDFNTASSFEAGYQSVTDSSNAQTRMSDPPYNPDHILQYPGNWDITPYTVAPYLTTSTRQSATIPNACGTGGGAKSWFDHIFISPWIVNGTNYISYVPGSYQTIGNDGNRTGVDINSSSPQINTSASAALLNSLFQFSNKYPVMLKLLIHANRNAVSPADPVE